MPSLSLSLRSIRLSENTSRSANKPIATVLSNMSTYRKSAANQTKLLAHLKSSGISVKLKRLKERKLLMEAAKRRLDRIDCLICTCICDM